MIKEKASLSLPEELDFLIIRLSSLGDIIHTLPALAALRKHFPQARIGWVVESKGSEILEWVSGLDRILVLPTSQRKPAGFLLKPALAGFFKTLRQALRSQGKALDFQGLLKSGLIAFLSGARTRLGFSRPNLREPQAAWFYTQTVPPFDETNHVIDKNLRLLQLLGVSPPSWEFPLVVEAKVKEKIKTLLSELQPSSNLPILVANVGAAWPTKRWPASHWIDYLRKIRASGRFSPFILWGTPEERKLAEEISRESKVPRLPYLTIKEVMALIDLTDLLVSGDTFALQVAAALEKPTVGLFGPTNPQRNGPWHKASRVAVTPLECRNCYARRCREATCLAAIPPEEVWQLTLELVD